MDFADGKVERAQEQEENEDRARVLKSRAMYDPRITTLPVQIDRKQEGPHGSFLRPGWWSFSADIDRLVGGRLSSYRYGLQQKFFSGGPMRLSAQDGWNVPFDSPFYPPLPARYEQVFFQLVSFRSDPTVVESLLPEPLQPSADGRCVAMGIGIPTCSAYGTFEEAALQLACRFGDQEGWYCSHVWHNGPQESPLGERSMGHRSFWRM